MKNTCKAEGPRTITQWNLHKLLLSSAWLSAKYRPAHGGKYCIGERRRYRSCSIQVNWSWLYFLCHVACIAYRCRKFSGVTSHRQPRQCRGAQGPKTVKGAQSDPNYVSRLLLDCVAGGGAKIIVTPLRKLLHMWHVLCSMVSVSLCVLGAPVSYAKTDEPIEMPLEADLCGPKKPCKWDPDPSKGRDTFDMNMCPLPLGQWTRPVFTSTRSNNATRVSGSHDAVYCYHYCVHLFHWLDSFGNESYRECVVII